MHCARNVTNVVQATSVTLRGKSVAYPLHVLAAAGGINGIQFRRPMRKASSRQPEHQFRRRV